MREIYNSFTKVDNLDITDRNRIVAIGIDPLLFSNCYILPGFTDVHVHLREPGFLFKETIKTGTSAAAAGGYTDVFSMPNLNPCPDSLENLKPQQEAINRDALVNVHPYGSITIGEQGKELAKFDSIASEVIAFTDDGVGVAKDEIMRSAMMAAKRNNKIIVAHCEDEKYPKESSESEWRQLKRDIELVREIGCKYHVCHISTKESVELIRMAKAEGLDITCETAPHYLTISAENIENHGRFKMNPPIKHREDMLALVDAIKDGTIDMIATDHAPHTAEEKNKGFNDSAFGIVGLETAFPVLYTSLVKSEIITLERLIELLYINPRKRFNLDVCNIKEELSKMSPTFTIWNMSDVYRINPSTFLSMGRSTPFEGWEVCGRCMITVVNGKIIQEFNDGRHKIHNIK